MGHAEFHATRRAFGRLVVNRDDVSVPGEVVISFDGIRSLLPGQAKGSQRVFGGVFGSPAMRDNHLRLR